MPTFILKAPALPFKRGYDALQHVHGEWRLMIMVAAFASGCLLQIVPNSEILTLSWLLFMAASVLVAAFVARQLQRTAVQMILALLMGMVCAAARIDRLHAPAFGPERYVSLEGSVKTVEARPGGSTRLIVLPSAMEGETESLPLSVRLLVRTDIRGELTPGTMVRTQALLHEPRGAITPDGFNFARKAYFDGIGAEGFAVAPIDVLGMPETGGLGVAAGIEGIRQQVAQRIMARQPDQSGAVAVALLVGYRHYLTDQTVDDFRDAGLAHLMAISGLHMGLITTAAFFLFEFLFAAFPGIALRVPPRKLAAVAAWSVALGYLLLSGMSTATVRAFIMVSIGLLAILLDRRVLSLRNVAIAAGIILSLWPEAILSVGFQMSFSATSALVVAYERLAKSTFRMPMGQGLLAKVGRFLAMTAFTTIVAEVAVAPFALYHFQATPLVGLGANLLAVPIVSLVVMPLALLALLVMPLGWDGPVLHLMGAALDLVRGVAGTFGAPSYGVAHIPQQSAAFIVVASIVLFLCLLLKSRTVWVPVVAGLLAAPFLYQDARNDLLIDSGGNIVAVFDQPAGRFDISGGRRGSFRDDAWARYWGISPDEVPGRLKRQCDSDGCLTRLPTGLVVARARSLGGMRRDCVQADIVIMPVRWRRYCRGDGVKLSEEGLARYGPVAYDLKTGEVRWSRERGNRPWHAGPKKEG
ncbi:ComEC/Rec2 family competence protein [Kordiimonas lacus]|uniref:Competence protein ComEC n=1 Tax=Kordiimonas lacus TaxID=637679 RepID=A0A1G6WD66_9PROT|nr:ComEC/Rec2 family competence protein [Kordiimonas lacus]SDD63791.1 competence protein ComEC [Kordiimonas lacus]